MTKKLDKHLLKSSNLDWVAYDEEKNQLYVQFRSNTLYVYDDVPKEVFEELLKAGSHGRYFAQKVKWNYKYKRLQ